MINSLVEGVEFEPESLEFGGFLVPESSALALDDEPVLVLGDGLSELIVDGNIHRLGSEFVDSEHLDETAFILPHLEVATVSLVLLSLLKEIAPREGHLGVEQFRLKLDGVKTNELEQTYAVVLVSLEQLL